MSLGIINAVKYHRWLYNLYYYIATFCIKVLRFFVKTDNKLIVFASFGGRKYDDSPRVIYEKMLDDPRFEDFKLVWAFINPGEFRIGRGQKVRIDTLRYYWTLLKARVWVTNSTMTRGLHFTGKNTFVINTWHGTPIKLMGTDVKTANRAFKPIKSAPASEVKGYSSSKRVRLAQGKYEVDVFSRVFNIDTSCFRVIGLPRNDILAIDGSEERKAYYKKLLGLPEGKKAILYAPTFREYEKDSTGAPVFSLPLDLDLWKRELGSDYVLLIRAHYEVARRLNLKDDTFARDVSSYPELTDLMLASDILLSDYSSIIIDYSILGRPILCYCYDYERYKETRGLYFDPREELSCKDIASESDLIEAIRNLDRENRVEIAKSFRSKYVESYGSAADQCLDLVYRAVSRI